MADYIWPWIISSLHSSIHPREMEINPPTGNTGAYSILCSRDREVPGLDTVVPLETTAAYDMKDIVLGVCGFEH